MLPHNPAFGFHLLEKFLPQRRKGANKALGNAEALCAFAPLREKLFSGKCIDAIFSLFSEPAVSVQELNTDAAVTVDVVDPGAVHFGGQLTTKWRRQLYS